MKHLMTLASAFATGSLLAATPVITEKSVTLTQDAATRTVTIAYTLQDAPAIVTIDIQTNGVSIGCRHFQHLGGDVNRKVAAGPHTITWQPDVEWGTGPQRMVAENVKAVVKAWACDAPPPYAVFDLVVPNTVRFYSCAEAVPGGITENPRYKEDLLVMRRIPAANVTWRMGSCSTEPLNGDKYGDDLKASEVPHYVMLTKDYYMGVFEVTQKQISYFGSVAATPAWAGDHRPMEMYSWAYIRGNGTWPNATHAVQEDSTLDRLRDLTGGVMFDLPTEAQWEYACRAGTGTGLNNGKECIAGTTNADEVAWHRNDVGSTIEHRDVGQKAPNAWGLYDMHGNVLEFCLDWYSTGDDYVASFGAGYKPGDTVVDPVGSATGSSGRVVRGGSIYGGPQYCRSALRGGAANRAANVGFRLCCPAEF